MPAGIVYVPSASGLIRRILPRRSFVLPDVRRASYARSASGLSPGLLRRTSSSIGLKPCDCECSVSSPVEMYSRPPGPKVIEPAEWQQTIRWCGIFSSTFSEAMSMLPSAPTVKRETCCSSGDGAL